MTGADRRKLNKDAGFSLLELLIAVVILAIIVIPLLNLFLSSNRINIKSRQTLRATTLAQDIMEGLKAYDIEELQAQFTKPADGFYVIDDNLIKGAVAEETGMEEDGSGNHMEGIYYFSLQKVALQGSEFDALVKVDAREYMEPGTHGNALDGDPLVLNKGIGDARSIDRDNGTFVEKDKYRQAMLRTVWPDDPASTPVKSAMIADGITKADFDKITFKNLDTLFTSVGRTIKITLTRSDEKDEEGNYKTDMSVTEEFQFAYQDKVFSTRGDMNSMIMVDNMACGVISGKDANVNLFYYPLYGRNTMDEIVINLETKDGKKVNLDSLNLLIAKQVPTVQVNPDEVLSDAQLMAAEMRYQVDVTIEDDGIEMDKEKFSLKTNLGTNLAGKTYMEAEGKKVDIPEQLVVNGFRMNSSGTSQMNIYTLDGVRSPMGIAGKDGEVTELFYNVEVSVYKEGAAGKGFPEEERMIVIEGSKNN